VQVDPFLDDELVLVVSPAHPFAAAGSVRAAALADQRLLLRERGSGTRDAVEEAFREAGRPLVAAMELRSSEAIKEAVAAGLGVTLLSRVAVRTEVASRRLVIVPVPELVIRRRFAIVHHKDKRLSASLRAFLEMLRAAVHVPA
jgi:DNA-binding transcriptional LysR family regulator